MLHSIPETALTIAIGRVADIAAPGTAIAVGLATQNSLPGWLNASIAGGVILVLLYLIKFLIGLWQAKDQQLADNHRAQMQKLEDENARLRRDLRELRNE